MNCESRSLQIRSPAILAHIHRWPVNVLPLLFLRPPAGFSDGSIQCRRGGDVQPAPIRLVLHIGDSGAESGPADKVAHFLPTELRAMGVGGW